MKHSNLLRRARRDSGKTADQICDAAGCTRLARALFRIYKGQVPLAHIYDPEFAGEVRAA